MNLAQAKARLSQADLERQVSELQTLCTQYEQQMRGMAQTLLDAAEQDATRASFMLELEHDVETFAQVANERGDIIDRLTAEIRLVSSENESAPKLRRRLQARNEELAAAHQKICALEAELRGARASTPSVYRLAPAAAAALEPGERGELARLREFRNVMLRYNATPKGTDADRKATAELGRAIALEQELAR